MIETKDCVEEEGKENASVGAVDPLYDTNVDESIIEYGPPYNRNTLHRERLHRHLVLTHLILQHLLPHLLSNLIVHIGNFLIVLQFVWILL